jgi:hypothetical protein
MALTDPIPNAVVKLFSAMGLEGCPMGEWVAAGFVEARLARGQVFSLFD